MHGPYLGRQTVHPVGTTETSDLRVCPYWNATDFFRNRTDETEFYDHVRSLMMQCQSARVPMFVKQLGSVPVMSETEWRKPGFPTRLLNARNHRKAPPGTVPIKLFDKKGGNPEEWPINLRAREFPKSAAERASA